MTGPHSSRFPEPLADDDDDVAWALQTAKVQWNRGARPDAVVWLRRAADSADSLGNVWRANDLRRLADEFDSYANEDYPLAPAPQSIGGNDVDDLLGDTEDSGIVSIPPPPQPLPSYAPVDDFEVEEEIEAEPEEFDEEVVLGGGEPDSSVAVVQLLGNEIELTEEVVALDEEEAEEIDAEPLELEDEDDVIDDDALSVEPSIAPGTTPFEEADDPVTQPQLDDPRFLELPRRSPAPPPRLSPPPPSRASSRAPSRLPPEPELELPEPDPELPPEPEGDPQLGDVLLGEVSGLEDVPPEGQAVLVRDAVIERINANEEISSFGLALVLNGSVHVMPAIADLSCARVSKREIVWSQGNIDDGVALRLMGAEEGTEVAVWDAELVKSTIREFPWVLDDLKTLADRFQALAGVAMGPIGERLDDALRAMVTERCQIRRLLPNELLATKGKPVGGMYIVAAGRIEIVNDEAVESEVGPGDFLFAPQILSNGAAPRDARAGKNGALVLFAQRSVAHDLLLSVPPLLEIFAS